MPNTSPIIQDYLEAVRDDVGYTQLLSLNNLQNEEIKNFDKNAIAQEQNAKAWAKLTGETSTLDLKYERRKLIDGHKIDAAKTALPEIDDRKLFESITRKHIKDEKAIEQILLEDTSITLKQESALEKIKEQEQQSKAHQKKEIVEGLQKQWGMSKQFNQELNQETISQDAKVTYNNPEQKDTAPKEEELTREQRHAKLVEEMKQRGQEMTKKQEPGM